MMMDFLGNFPSELKSIFPLVENCPMPWMAVDADGIVHAANPAFWDLFEEQIPSGFKNISELDWRPIDEEGNPVRGATVDMDLLLRNLEKGHSTLLFMLNSEESAYTFRISIGQCHNAPGMYSLWLEMLGESDSISKTPPPESSLASFETRLTGLYSQLLRTQNVSDALQLTCRHLQTYLQCSTVFVLAAQPELKPVFYCGDWGPDFWGPVSGNAVLDAHPALWAFLGQKPVHIRDTQSVPEIGRLREWFRQKQVSSILVLPLTADEKLGVLCLYHRQLFAFPPLVTTRVEQLATDLALLLQKHQGLEKIEHCRKKFQQIQFLEQYTALHSREFSAVFRTHPEKLEWIHFSPSCANLLEIPKERLSALPNGLFSLFSDKKQLKQLEENLANRKSFSETWEFQSGSGKKLFIRIHAAPREQDVEIWDLLGLDVTEIVHMQISCRRSMALWKIVSNLGDRLNRPDFKSALPEVLADFGKAAEVSRVYLFENHLSENGDLLTSQWMEWVAPGVKPQIQNPDLQALSLVENGFQRWVDELGANRPILGNIIDFPPTEQEALVAQSIISIAVVPVFVDGQWWGFLGMDECASPRNWSEPEIESLRTAAAILGNAISRERSYSEKAWMEKQLQTTTRRENMGRLAHGIAHQFNNLLSPILGYISVALYDLPPSSPLAQDLKEVRAAAERARELAHQLLRLKTRTEYQIQTYPVRKLAELFKSFSEETRIPVQATLSMVPENALLKLDPEPFREALFALLRRALPPEKMESSSIAPTILMQKASAPGVGEDQLLLEIPTIVEKLPARGFLDSANLTDINWADLDIMQAVDILQTFGIHISLISKEQPRVLLQFPLFYSTISTKTIETSLPENAKEKMHVVILVVEDEDAVRNFVARALSKHGHTVLDAPDPQKALALAEDHPDPIHLLITDVIMPHMSGKRLYQELRKKHPGLKVIYMSGYTAPLLEKQGVAPEKRNFLSKPFGISALLKIVEETLSS